MRGNATWIRVLGILCAAAFGSYAWVAYTAWREMHDVGPLHSAAVAGLVAVAGFALALQPPSKGPVATAQGVILGALTLGLLGLFGGTYAGAALWPASPLGPALGFLVTGPAGLVAGGVLGGLLAIRAGRRRNNSGTRAGG